MGIVVDIFLVDKSVDGIRTIGIRNWTGQAIAFPRVRIKEIEDEEAIKNMVSIPGIYFLFGFNDRGENTVYIGKSDNVLERLRTHDKEFEEAIVFTNKRANLNLKYIESKIIKLSKKINRYKVLNNREEQEPVMEMSELEAMNQFIENMKIILGVLGYKVLEPLIIREDEQETEQKLYKIKLKLHSGKVEANAYYTDEGIVVLRGSQAVKEVRNSIYTRYVSIRENLKENEVLVEKDDYLEFSQDYLFKSPSQAACVILGSSVNGYNVWINDEGEPLKKILNNDNE